MIKDVLTLFFLELQKDWSRFSSTVPKPDRWTPNAASLLISRGIGDCQRPSHQAGGRSGVNAHWWDWWWQLNGPANRFQTCPQPTWSLNPPVNKLLWKLLKNEKLKSVELSPERKQVFRYLQYHFGNGIVRNYRSNNKRGEIKEWRAYKYQDCWLQQVQQSAEHK